MKIGFHMSISKGFDRTLEEAKRLHCEAVQIFVKNPRSWGHKELTDEDVESFRRLSRKVPVFAHLSYLPNLARTDTDQRGLRGLLQEADLCEKLGIRCLVVHPGSNTERKKGIQNTARAVNILHELHDITVLLENTAGQGNVIGRNGGELVAIMEGIEDKCRTMFCIDTAHLFEAGYDIRNEAVWERFIGEISIDRIGLFHLNDSKTAAGTHADRHWHIGRGEIGIEFFRTLLNDKRFAHLTGIMETPKMGNMDEINMKIMRSLPSPLVSGPSS